LQIGIEVEPMIDLAVLIPATLLLAGLLYFEKQGKLKWLLPTKTALSSLFVVTALVQPHPHHNYYLLILLGLLFCLVGDVFLALEGKMMFTVGLFSFLIGHIFYCTAFFHIARIGLWTWVGAGTVLVISGGVYIRLRSHLDSMEMPVLVYVVVISVMVTGAWTVFGDPQRRFCGSTMVFLGALGFYFSDVFVARDRFVQKDVTNRLIGLPLYYGGQFLFAFSVGLL
jgi:uncharacterized membrane protein YhhN